MASASVKSFLIADLLVGKSKPEEKSEKPLAESFSAMRKERETDNGYRIGEKIASNASNSSRTSTPTGNVIDARKFATTVPRGSPLSTSEDDRSEKSPMRDERPSTVIKYDAGPISGGYYHQYHGFPIGFPISALPINATANSLTESESGAKNYSSLLPYNFDSFRQTRHLYGRHHSAINPLMLPPVSAIPNGGHIPSGMDYPSMYPTFAGLYGLPVTNGLAAMHDKGPAIVDRDYSMFQLGRQMYTVSCKRKGGQIRFSNSQTVQLEKAFVQQKYLNATDRKKLAHSLGLSDRQVKTWFQNRRAKLRKCKGGMCTESEVSGSPQDSRAFSPQTDNDSIHYDNNNMRDVKKTTHCSRSN